MDCNTRNVIQLAVGFFFLFTAFNSQGLIQETVISSYAHSWDNSSISEHDGYTSLAIVYGVFTAANFLAAPIVEGLNARWAMVVGGLSYVLFQAGFLFLNRVYLFASSASLGVGAAVIWTAQGKYLSLNSTEQTSGKHSGLFWAISQACLIIGGIFLFTVFHSSNDTHSIPEQTAKFIALIFTVISGLGVLILAVLRLPTSQQLPASSEGVLVLRTAESSQLSQFQVLKSTLKLAATAPMLLLAVAAAYTGVELGFWSGIYSTCIANTNGLGTNTKTLLALNAITQGLGQGISGLLFGVLGSRTRRLGRNGIIGLGAVIHLLTFTIIFINFPSNAPLEKTDATGLIKPNVLLALLGGFLLGFGDACWNTQIFAHLIAKYPTRSSQAFSLFKFFQSLLASAAFLYSKVLVLHWHLLILVVGLVAGLIGFFFAEKVHPGNKEGNATQIHDD